MAKRKSLTEEETTPLRDGQGLNNMMKEFIAEMVNDSLAG